MALVLELRRTMPASRAGLFTALGEPDQLSRWWGPEGFSIPSVDFHPRPGAAYAIEMQPPGSESFWLRGEFREVEPPARLAFTFVWDPADADDVETVAELEFTDGEDALRQGEFKTQERLELHRAGWTESFDKLERLLA